MKKIPLKKTSEKETKLMLSQSLSTPREAPKSSPTFKVEASLKILYKRIATRIYKYYKEIMLQSCK
jgi:hypothetical protein